MLKDKLTSIQFDRLIRFCIVGVANTTIDVTLFTILRLSDVPLVLANASSTSVALAASLLLNYRFTFQSKSLTRKKIIGYIIITLIGLWVLQPIVIKGIMDLNSYTGIFSQVTNRTGHAKALNTIIPKIGSIGVTLIWNYIWYSNVIFKDESRSEKVGIAIEDI